eukprot:g4956.t1
MEVKDGIQGKTPLTLSVDDGDVMDSMMPDLEAIGKDLARFEKDPTLRDAIFSRGLDIREYWKQTESELTKLQHLSIEDYMKPESMRLAAELHSHFTECAKTLDQAEKTVKGFQRQLGTVSDEMKILHEKCSSVRVKVENREKVLKHLTQFLGQVAVSNDMKAIIKGGRINDEFVEQLVALDQKIDFVRSPESLSNLTRAAHNVAPQLEELRNEAVRHVREYLNKSILSIRKTSSSSYAADAFRSKIEGSAQRTQRDKLQRFKTFPPFLRRHAPSVYAEIEDAYMNTMRKLWTQSLRAYHDALMRHTGEMCTAQDTIVLVNESSRLSIFSKRQKVQRNNETFGLNGRDEALAKLEQSKPGWREVHVVKSEAKSMKRNKVLRIETTCRSVVARVSASCTFEFLFLETFFGPQRQIAVFKHVVGEALAAHVTQLQAAVAKSYDLIGLLLLLHTTNRASSGDDHGLGEALAKPMRDMYYDKMAAAIRKRIHEVVKENAALMQNADVRKIGSVTLHAHVSSLRFAHLICSMTAVSSWSGFVSDVTGKTVSTLCDHMRTLLGRLANSAHSTKTDRAVFLTNNIDVILATFREHQIDIEWASSMQKLMEKQIYAYIDALLESKFGRLLAFVREFVDKSGGGGSGGSSSTSTSGSDKGGGVRKIRVAITDMPTIALEFSKNYKQHIKYFDSVVIKSFQNALLAVTVAKRLFTVLLR